MSELVNNGYEAGQASFGKDKMSDFESSQRPREYMVGYCIARAEYEGSGTPMVYYSLGEHAGFYGLSKQEIKPHFNLKNDDDDLFDTGYDIGDEERRSLYEDDYE
ncbi:hypothetical protein QWU01_25330 [Kluyvera cryocrescens]|uniref:Uncharacterized protein n=1 Tax=Kluyvera cryocrescens TaxID=580 RepID=A0AAW9CGA8_KLUCR|nr:hypothetical protein [Kluyvera cryocrescens]MDW3780120.1 hypothetical protein [Kluyvera cryocrescens]